MVAGRFSRGRIAVSALFFANGFTVGSWAPKIPEFAARLGLSESALGLMIVAFGIGSLVFMPVAGALIARHGSMKVVRVFALMNIPALLILTLAPSIPVAAIVILLLGGTIGAMDVSMNANVVVVERRYRRAIMSSCHGFWSLGGLAGATIGGVLIAYLGVFGHVLVVTAIVAAVTLAIYGMILEDEPETAETKVPVSLPKTLVPYLIGIMALFSMMPEGAVLDWGALYLRQELSATLSESGLAFGAFSAAMAVMRFAGDPIRDRLGAVMTMRVCAVLALVGMVIAGQAPNALMATIGFALSGLGIANMVPIAFSAAGNYPGLARGVGMSLVTTMGYSGILLAPSIIGFVAEHTGFAAVFTSLPILFLVVLAVSGLARFADVGDK